MADQPGFFEGLVGSSVDEKTQAKQVRNAGMANASRRTQAMNSLGQQAATGLSAGIAGMFGKERGQRMEDRITANTLGLQVEDVVARRRIRKETADITDDGTFTARKKMAKIAARIANEEGSGVALARALSAIKGLDEEEEQFDWMFRFRRYDRARHRTKVFGLGRSRSSWRG